MAQFTPTAQVLPRQQPLVHEVASQVQVAVAPVPVHLVPAGHGPPVEPHTHALLLGSQRLVLVPPVQLTHAAPMAPHEVSPSVVHVAPVQQPVVHKVELQPEQTPSGLGDWPQVPPAPHEVQIDPL